MINKIWIIGFAKCGSTSLRSYLKTLLGVVLFAAMIDRPGGLQGRLCQFSSSFLLIVLEIRFFVLCKYYIDQVSVQIQML